MVGLKFAEDDYYIAKQFWSGFELAVALYVKAGDHEQPLYAHIANDLEDADHLLAIIMDRMELYK